MIYCYCGNKRYPSEWKAGNLIDKEMSKNEVSSDVFHSVLKMINRGRRHWRVKWNNVRSDLTTAAWNLLMTDEQFRYDSMRRGV